MKCIGGPFDGFKVTDGGWDIWPDIPGVIKAQHYTKRRVTPSDGAVIEFYAPVGISDREILTGLLT